MVLSCSWAIVSDSLPQSFQVQQMKWTGLIADQEVVSRIVES
jgi:hypothetical protein